jgi:hypothetical protein
MPPVKTSCLMPLGTRPHHHHTLSPVVNESRGAYHDLGKFLTGFLVVTGLGTYSPFLHSLEADWIALPVALFHSNIIAAGAMVMSILGGLLIYGTITVYSHFFSNVTEEF